jgi:hypothetical protein
MADHRPDRPDDAGDRNRLQRRRTRLGRVRSERWALADDGIGRPHRVSRVQPTRRRSR